MLKKVASSQLRVGMFIHDLDCGWMEHPFVRNRFSITTEDEIRKIVAAGIRSVTIDCTRGLDVADAPTVAEAEAATEAEVAAIAARPVAPLRTTLAEEFDRAKAIRRQAADLVKTVMQDARLGKAVEMDKVSPVVENITASILRNASALLGLSAIKTKDDYTFLHSVSVCTLLVAFCRSRKLDEATTYQAGIGGLLHDTGKALVPDAILNKPGRLTDEEFDIVRAIPGTATTSCAVRPGSARSRSTSRCTTMSGATARVIRTARANRTSASWRRWPRSWTCTTPSRPTAATTRASRRPRRCARCMSGASSISIRR